MNERDFPHIVEIPLPPGGLGDGTVGIAAFHSEPKIAPRFGRGRRDDGAFRVRLCFADAADAEAFRDRFGGTRVESDAERK